MTTTPSVIFIYGPTGVGKSDLAILLAQHTPVEIINMDVGQFYTPITIGTAKPNWRAETAPHHLFDIIDQPRNLTVSDYRALLTATLQGVWSRGRMPVVVGGSGFYLKSFLFPPLAEPNITCDLEALYGTDAAWWDILYDIDAQRAQAIHTSDTYRIKRALEIWHKTGEKPSQRILQYEPVCPYRVIFVARDRAQLYARIDERTIHMLKNGWIEEVAALRSTAWEAFLKTKALIGYPEILHHLENNLDLSKTTQIIQQETRHYAKRQFTFWNMLKRSIEARHQAHHPAVELATVNLTHTPTDRYIESLLYRIEKQQYVI
jgi:tRNA dimethylallyltransferase